MNRSCLLLTALAAGFLFLFQAEAGNDPFADQPENSPGVSPSPKASKTAKKLQATITKFHDQFDKLIKAHRLSLAELVTEADSIELYQLDDAQSQKLEGEIFSYGADDPNVSREWFPVRDEQVVVKIVKTLKLSAEQREKVSKIVKRMLLEPGHVRAACFEPHHGIRMWSGKKMLFESAICLECSAFTIPSPHPYVSDWQECLPDFVGPVLTELMPPLPPKPKEEPQPKAADENKAGNAGKK